MLLLCLLLGWLLRQGGVMDARSAQALNRVAIWVALPALTLHQLHRVEFTPELFLLAALPWGIFAITWLVVRQAARFFSWNTQTEGALLLTVGLGNTSFVGFPLLELLYGKEAIPFGVVIDQPGTFLVLSTLGVVAAKLLSEKVQHAQMAGLRRPSPPRFQDLFLRVVKFPPFIATVLALALRSWTFPEPLDVFLERLGNLLAPLALLSVGLTLNLDPKELRAHRAPLAFGLGLRLFAFPALTALLYSHWLSTSSLPFHVAVCEAAMAPMITSSLLAQDSELNAPLASLMLGLGIVLSFLSVPAWSAMLGFFWPI